MIRFFRLLDHDPGLRLQIASSTLGKDALISGNRAHREPEVAAAGVRGRAVQPVRIDGQVVSADRVRRILRRRPIVAVRIGTVDV